MQTGALICLFNPVLVVLVGCSVKAALSCDEWGNRPVFICYHTCLTEHVRQLLNKLVSEWTSKFIISVSSCLSLLLSLSFTKNK